jgi:hypothetical protein
MKNKNHFVYQLCFSLFMLSTQVHADFFSVALLGGPNFTTLRNASYVEINPVVTNLYQSTQQQQTKGIVALSIGHTFEKKWFSSYELSYRVSGYLMNLGQVSGIEYPLINQGVFDTLNYRFQTHSGALLFEPQLTYTAYGWSPFVRVGLGVAQNKLNNYHEWPSDPASSAAAVFPMFSAHTASHFAYDLGLGIQSMLVELPKDKLRLMGAVNYQYFNLGQAQLGSFPAQTSNSRLQINHVDTQALLFQLALSFG